jgi:WD40 repeat protein
MKTILAFTLVALNLTHAVCYKKIINYKTAKIGSGFGYILKDEPNFVDTFILYDSKGKELSRAGLSKSGRSVAEEIRFLSPKYVLVTYIHYTITGGFNIDVDASSRGQVLFTIKNKKDLELYLNEFKDVAASQNGKYIAYNKVDIKGKKDKEVRTNNIVILDSQTDKETIIKKVPLEVSVEDISNDGKNVVYIDEDDEDEELQYIKVYNIETNKIIFKQQVTSPLTLSNSKDEIGKNKTPYFKYFLVRFTPDGKSLLVGGHLGKEIRQVDISSGKISKYKP